jgi:hypothetical protein
VGRDPASLAQTYLISLACPNLLGWKTAKQRGTVSGSPPEIAAVLAGYEALGAAHLMFHLQPASSEAYARLAEAVQIYRSSG